MVVKQIHKGNARVLLYKKTNNICTVCVSIKFIDLQINRNDDIIFIN